MEAEGEAEQERPAPERDPAEMFARVPSAASSGALLATLGELFSAGEGRPGAPAEVTPDRRSGGRPVRLTAREIDVLQRIGLGRRTGEIAQELGITRKTVETHRTTLMRKLGLHRLADVVRYAVGAGLVEANAAPSPGAAVRSGSGPPAALAEAPEASHQR